MGMVFFSQVMVINDMIVTRQVPGTLGVMQVKLQLQQ